MSNTPTPELPDLWDVEAVQKWLNDQITEALLELLKYPKPIPWKD